VNKERWIFFACLLMVTFFWVVQKLDRQYLIKQRYRVTYILPDGKVFKRKPLDNILVNLQGKGWDILVKSAKNIGDRIEVELSEDNNQVIYSNSIAEKINAKLASNEISVSRIVPSEIRLLLEDQASKSVPVESNLNITYMDGYFRRDVMHFTPDSVIITGAPEQLRSINTWPTEKVKISNLHNPIKDMPIRLSESENNLVRINVNQVKLNMDVEEYTDKVFSVPLHVKNADKRVRLLPDRVNIRCTVGISKYESLSPDDVELYLNLDESLLSASATVAPIAVSKMPVYVRSFSFSPRAAHFFYVK